MHIYAFIIEVRTYIYSQSWGHYFYDHLIYLLSYLNVRSTTVNFFNHGKINKLKGGGHVHFHNAFLALILSLGDVEPKTTFLKFLKFIKMVK